MTNNYNIELGGTITIIYLLIFFAFLNIVAPGVPFYLVTVTQIMNAIGWTVLVGVLILALIGLLLLFAAMAS